MGGLLFEWFFKLVSIIFRIFLRPFLGILNFTGSWIFFPFVIMFTDGFKRPIPISILNPFDTQLFSIIFYLGFFIMFYVTTQNVFRIIKSNPEFKLSTLFFISKKRDKTIQGNADPLKVNSNNLSGVFFGKVKNSYIVKKETEDGHILVIGGAGSGKSSCIAIPSLMTWKERIFAIDIKGELAEKSNRNAIIFNPCNEKNEYGYDPYYLLKQSTNRVQDAKEIALCLIPLTANIKDPFWINSAQNLLTAFILYYSEKGLGFIKTLETVQITPVLKMIDEISNSENFEAKMFINQFIGLKTEVISGIYTELSNNIMIFVTDSQIKKALLNEKSINPTFIENGENIFLQIPEHKIEQWKGLLNLIIQQFLKHFERRPDGKGSPVLFLLDEFARMGKIDVIINGLATLRSKRIHICILTQSLAQLDAIYGKTYRQVIADNCNYKAILKATDAETQEYFSRLVGTYDKRKVTNSESYEKYTKLGKGTSRSVTTEEKRIIRPEEFAYLNEIVLITPFGYAKIEKAPYYLISIFKNLKLD